MPGFALSNAEPHVERAHVHAEANTRDEPHQRLRALIDANWTTQAIATLLTC